MPWDNHVAASSLIERPASTTRAGWETISARLRPHTESKMDACMIHLLQPKKPRSNGGLRCVGMLLPGDPPSSIYGRAATVVLIFDLAVSPPQPWPRYNASSYRCGIGCLIFSAHHHPQPTLQVLFKTSEPSPER